MGLFDNKELEPEVVKTIAKELVVEEKDVVEMNRRLGGDKSLNVTAGDDSEDEKLTSLLMPAKTLKGLLHSVRKNSCAAISCAVVWLP